MHKQVKPMLHSKELYHLMDELVCVWELGLTSTFKLYNKKINKSLWSLPDNKLFKLYDETDIYNYTTQNI